MGDKIIVENKIFPIKDSKMAWHIYPGHTVFQTKNCYIYTNYKFSNS